MKPNIFHRTVEIALIVVMSLTSTGFTTVVSYCSMSNSSICCCGADPAATSSLPVHDQVVRRVQNSCYSESVVGGVNDIHAVLSLDVSSKAVPHSIEAEAPDCHQSCVLACTASTSRPLFEVGIPPDVDIYIRVSALLI